VEEEIKGGRTLEASELGRHFGYYGKRRPGQRQYDKSHDVGRVHSRLSEFRVNAEGSERSFQTRRTSWTIAAITPGRDMVASWRVRFYEIQYIGMR